MARTTYNLRFTATGEWRRGYRTRKQKNAEAEARHVADVTGEPVDVYGGEGPYRNVVYSTPSAVEFRRERGIK